MLTFADFNAAVTDSLTDIVSRTISYIPNLVGAAIILIVGWVVAAVLEWAVDNVLRAVGLQTLFEKVKIEDIVKKADAKKDTSGLVAAVVKWVVMIVSVIAATSVLGLTEVSNFLNSVLGYVGTAAQAAVVLVIGAIAAHFFSRVVRGVVQAAQLAFADLAGSVTKYSILTFTVIAALAQLGIATAFLQTLFTGFVAMLAIAGGLSFGLGGQGAVKDLIEKVKKETEIGK